MAKVFACALPDPRAYAGQYLSYVNPSMTLVLGGLVSVFDLDAIPVKRAMESFFEGFLPDGRGVRNAGHNAPDALGRRPQRFLDLQLTMEKSVSVLMVCLSNEVQRETIRTAVKEALITAYASFEDRFAVSRAGSDGARRHVPAKSFAPAFFEDSARPADGKIFGDPHFHAHILMSLTGIGEDGKVRAIDSRVVFDAMPFLSTAVTAELVANLSRAGFRAGLDDRGHIEIEGVSKDLCTFFSTRTREANAYMAKHGLDASSMKDRDRAMKFSRSAKESGAARHEHFEYWRAEAGRAGFDLEAMEAEILGREPKPEILKEIRKGTTFETLSGVLEDISSEIPGPHLHDVEERMMQQAARQEFQIHLGDVLEAARAGALAIGATLHGLRDWRVNRQLTARLENLSTSDGPSILQPRIDRVAEQRGLTETERDALEGLTRGGPQLRVLDLPSGEVRGKILGAAAEALKSAGIDCIAIAQGKKATAELGTACNTPSFHAAAANREWDKTEWGFGKTPGANQFKRVTTDALTDNLAYYSGVISKQEFESRGYHRWRQPLDLSGRPHAVLIDAHAMSKKVLNELLGHIAAQSKHVTVILAGSAEQRPRSAFAKVVDDYGAYPMERPSFAYEEKDRAQFRFEPNPSQEQSR